MSLIPYNDRDGLIWLDGTLIPFRDAKLHVLTHGLHYASCVFEGERAYEGEVFHLTEHSQRLIDSAKLMDFTIPYSVEEIDRATRETVAANKMPNCYVRPVAWRGSEMMGVSAQHNKIHVAIAVWEWPSYFSPEAKMKGLRLQISDWRRPAPNTAPTKAKAAGLYMICTLSKHKAEREGYQDALMLDWRGQVAEATGANIFFSKDGKLHTPTPDCFLDGITRRAVMAMARARGIEVIERAIMPEEMSGFEECFLTGTAAEVTPVSEIGPYSFKPGRICQTLLADFDAATRRKAAA
ncbi:MAG: branched-chain amino acid aminotransferase [Ferrovibrio sp.]|uniref:branched-chain amino acid aminotransferase n=1 Tax=Ferrovibrio sp. TaxID=1917215 RepID=UPI00391AB500